MAASSRCPRLLWEMPEKDFEAELDWDRPPSPPLMCEERDGGEEVEKDDVHGCLVVGRRPLIPGQSSLRDAGWSELRGSASQQRARRREKYTVLRIGAKHVERSKTEADKRVNRGGDGATPSQNDLRVPAAEVVTRTPEYRGVGGGERDHPNTSSRVDLRRFDVRMGTFSGREWQRGLPSQDEMARAGFYYSGMEDRVVCFSCGVKLDEWGDEEPLARHCKASPHCTFLRQDFPEKLESFTPSPTSAYSNTSLRLHSFSTWPLSSVVTSYQLASVGFYYTGEGTKVVCFSCGLEVREWKRGDVPLLVHCRANPECSLIKSIIEGPYPSERAPSPVLKTMATASRPNYSDLNVRFQSFKKLSPAFPIPRMKLAEAGLFLLRLPDVMKCHRCEGVLQGWVEGDLAVEKHRGVSPHCPFLSERFQNKMSSPVDPSTLPAAEFDESELEMMACQQPTLTPSHNSPTSTLSLAGLSLSDPHTLTSSHISQPPSLSHPPSYHASSGYHSMAQPHSLSTTKPQTMCSLEKQPSPYPSTAFSFSSGASPSLPAPSSGVVGGKTVSLPPSYPQGPPQYSLASAADTHKQPLGSLSASGECVVCMDRPLEMVFVPCGHICVCEECSSQISRCPICRTRTQMAVKVYFPY